MRAGLLLLPELWQSCGWGRDPVDVGAVVAAEPKQTVGTAEPNRTEGVVAPAVGDGEGALEDLGVLAEAVLAAVLARIVQYCAVLCSIVLAATLT